MFDIGGVELMVVAAVAILVVGPRELPGMLRAIGRFVKQARQMSSQVQRQFNDALKEAELDDVKKTIDDVRSLNPARQIRSTIAKELKPLTDVGDSVKDAVGEVKAEAHAATKASDAAASAPKASTAAPAKAPAASTASAPASAASSAGSSDG
ncbi:MAG: Sec-independent protein translocase protein TatB [Devosiaceae bacterium]|nr:Sec-independent protein translocase protein TatB [Devosiaceae bacterium MH13]